MAKLIEQRDQGETREKAKELQKIGIDAFDDYLDPVIDWMAKFQEILRHAKVRAPEDWDVWNHIDSALDSMSDAIDRLTEAEIYARLKSESSTDEQHAQAERTQGVE